MARSTAIVTTAQAGKYLQQLCKHWSHRFQVDFDPVTGRVDFGEGQAVDLLVQEGGLHLAVTVAEPAEIGMMERVVAEHLRRFAFREVLEFEWKREAGSA